MPDPMKKIYKNNALGYQSLISNERMVYKIFDEAKNLGFGL